MPIQVPVARASIIWLVGEFHKLIPTLAPDAFRKLTKGFRDEEDVARLQIVTLGVKLYLADNQVRAGAGAQVRLFVAD